MMAVNDQKFDTYDSDILIRSIDNNFFRCHLNFLSEKSDYFKNLKNFKNSKMAINNCSDEQNELNAISLPEIVYFDYNSKVVKFVFQQIYGQFEQGSYSFPSIHAHTMSNQGCTDLTDKDCIDIILLIDFLVTSIDQNVTNTIL